MSSKDSAALTPGNPVRRPALGALFLAIAALLGAGFSFWQDQQSVQEFGWFAYAPLSETVFVPGSTGWAISGWLLLFTGVGLLCLALGLVLGRKLTVSGPNR